MIRYFLAAGLLSATVPAIAADKLPANCVKQMVHTPAGKLVHNAPVHFCSEAPKQQVAQADAPRAPTDKRR